MKYQIFDRKYNKPVGKPYSSKERCRTRRDKLDNAYGAYHYYIKEVETGRNVL